MKKSEPKEKIVLSLSENYLEHWTVFDALRELYQNAFDRDRTDPEAPLINTAEFTDNKMVNMEIGNYNTALERRTLILGETSKKDDSSTVGKFGEGYKLALLVLLRNGIGVEISTGNERWVALLEDNEQFKTKMLTIHVWDQEETKDLSFHVLGIPKNIYHAYSQYNLRLQPNLQKKVFDRCEILLDQRNKGKVFIGGLYVCDYPKKALYGYNFAPDVFPLGRDRRIIDGFNLSWESSRALVDLEMEDVDMIQNISENIKDAPDSKYIGSFSRSSTVLTSVLWEKFIKEYPDSIPVPSSSDIKSMQSKYVGIKCVVIDEHIWEIIRDSEDYKKALDSYEEKPPRKKPVEIVNSFYDEYCDDMSDHVKQKFAEIIMAESVDWINGN